MASNAGHPAPVSQETYWKRRVFVLAGLFVVVALIAWACSAVSSDNGEQAGSVDPDALDTETSPPPEDGDAEPPEDEPSPDDEDGAADDDDDEESGPGVGGGSGGGTGPGPSNGAVGSDGADIPEPQQAEDPCRPSDVVVTLETDKETYAAGEEPRIELTVVNTGQQTCTVDVGPATMELQITSGDDRVYSTVDCNEDESDEEQVRRGVPLHTTFTWDRTRSWPDCRDEERSVGAGWYVVHLYSIYDEGADEQPFRLS